MTHRVGETSLQTHFPGHTHANQNVIGNSGPTASAVPCVTITDLLKKSPIGIHELLLQDVNAKQIEDDKISWYHSEITRDVAEQLLRKGPLTDGYFLVRDSSQIPGNFVVSLVSEGKILHYQIQKCQELIYCIDGGDPKFTGLEQLILACQSDCHGLPAKLTSFCRGNIPPSNTIQYGYSNLLHCAVSEGNLQIVKKILSDKLCQDVTAKDKNGSTALHEACFHGFDDIVSELIESAGAKENINIKNSSGLTPLHLACIGNKPKSIEILIYKGGAEPQERCTGNGWVPLHEAASRGFVECVKVLLSCNAPCRPRNDDKETPRVVAKKNGHMECVRILETYQSPPARTNRNDWLHENLNRKDTKDLLEKHGLTNGLFLVRNSSKHPGRHVVALAFSGASYNYEIRNEGKQVYYIDDGPFLESLEHVVEHYCKRADGLPTKLITAIKPDGTILSMNIPQMHDQVSRPNLPPRPPSLEERTSLPKTGGLNEQKQQEILTSRGPMSPPPHEKTGPTARSLPPPPVAEKKVTADSLSPVKKVASPKPHVRTKNVHNQVNNAGTKSHPPVPAKPETTFIHVLRESIELGHELGQGEFGSVMKGTFRDGPSGKRIDVAVKTLREEHMQTGKSEFEREAQVMCGLNHSCIVKLIGICDGPPMMLIQELVMKGSLLDYLLDYPNDISHPTDLYLWAAQIACGMMYLETKHFVHRDLAARNILLASKAQAKISDFGLSRAVGAGSDYYKASAGGRWPVKWYAPESVNYGNFSHASDVWSYGITLWEMFSFGEQPYGDMNGAQVIAWLEKGKRLHPPDNYKKCPDKVYEIMLKCWKSKPAERPTFMELHNYFQTEDEYASIHEIWSWKQQSNSK